MEFPNGPWRPYERSTTAIIIVAAAGQGGIESSGAPRGSVLARAGRRTLVISCELEGIGTRAALSVALEPLCVSAMAARSTMMAEHC